jgi:hypothetical protein
MNITEFLLWLVAGGSVIAVSWVMEQILWFQTLAPSQRKWIQYVASAVLGLIALAVQLYVAPEVLEKVSPFFAVLASTFGLIFLNQIAHSLNPSRK